MATVFEIEFTGSAFGDLHYLRKSARNPIIDAIEQQLVAEPHTQTRNRKPLRPNKRFTWEMRGGSQRVFYDVNASDRR